MSKKRTQEVRLPRYMKKLLAQLPHRQLTPGLHQARVYHDPWCAFLKGGECDCNPDVVVDWTGVN